MSSPPSLLFNDLYQITSFVLAFDSELEAFRHFAALYPESAVLLVDTYNVLDSGLPNALNQTRVICSGDLDEHIIHNLKTQGAKEDSAEVFRAINKSRVSANGKVPDVTFVVPRREH